MMVTAALCIEFLVFSNSFCFFRGRVARSFLFSRLHSLPSTTFYVPSLHAALTTIHNFISFDFGFAINITHLALFSRRHILSHVNQNDCFGSISAYRLPYIIAKFIRLRATHTLDF